MIKKALMAGALYLLAACAGGQKPEYGVSNLDLLHQQTMQSSDSGVYNSTREGSLGRRLSAMEKISEQGDIECARIFATDIYDSENNFDAAVIDVKVCDTNGVGQYMWDASFDGDSGLFGYRPHSNVTDIADCECVDGVPILEGIVENGSGIYYGFGYSGMDEDITVLEKLIK